MGIDGTDGQCVALLVTTICLGRELDDRMQRNLDVWEICLREVVERVTSTMGSRVVCTLLSREYCALPPMSLIQDAPAAPSRPKSMRAR